MKLLVALGGNAIKQADEAGTTAEQFANCEKAAEQLAEIVGGFGPEDWLVITHGNGPQSGNLSVQMEAAREKVPVQDLDVIGAMTQGQIGYMLQNSMQKHLKSRGIEKDVIAVINQVVVDPDDPEFVGDAASKPVGNFFSEEEAKALKSQHPAYVVKEVKPGVERMEAMRAFTHAEGQRRGIGDPSDPRAGHHCDRLRRRRGPGDGG